MTRDPCVTRKCLLVAGSEKIHAGCQELCLYLMWNDTYMTAKSEHNCSVNNEKKCSQSVAAPQHPHSSTSFISLSFNFEVVHQQKSHKMLMDNII